MHSGGLELALVLLLAAVIAVPVFKKFGFGAVLGYLAAGVVLGPDGLGFVQDADRILGAAEIGVVMLLFVIGLELSPARLKVMRRSVFGAGTAQVALSGLVLGGLLLLDHFQWKSALVVGVALALSSTAVGLQLLSASESRHELEPQIEPFTGLLLGLFFIAVGMGIDLDRIAAEPWLIAAGVAILLVVKFSLLYVIGRIAKLSSRQSLLLGSVLWLGGEFAFVVFNEAQRAHLLGNANHDRLVAIVGLSMAITPLLMIALLKLLGQEKAAPRQAAEADKVAPDNRPKVLIAGMGRFGQVIARLLTAQKVPFVALEANPDTVADLRRFGNQLYYGDPTRPEMLRAAGGEHIDVFVITVDDPETNLRAVRMVRRLYPDATVLARARNRQHAWRLMDMSAEPFREVFGTSLEMSGRVLTALGVAPDVAERHVQRFREHDEQLLRDQYLVYDDEAAVIQTSRDARNDLMHLFEADAESDGK
jgi:Kef-type K+ transport system membrane component KefB/voltage-gated potassium channel Kch